jgi:hypothetical protein
MGATHFLMKTLSTVRTEQSLHVLAYNLKRTIQLLAEADSRRLRPTKPHESLRSMLSACATVSVEVIDQPTARRTRWRFGAVLAAPMMIATARVTPAPAPAAEADKAG